MYTSTVELIGLPEYIHPLYAHIQLRWLTTFDSELIISSQWTLNSLRLSWRRRWFFATKVSARVAQADRIKQSRCLYTRLPLPRTLTWNGYKITQLQRDHGLTLGDRRSSSFSPLDSALFPFPSDSRCSVTTRCWEKETKREKTGG